MPVYIKYGDHWLRIKEVYTIQSTTTRRRRGSKSSRAAPYGMVAEAVKSVPINGYKLAYETIVTSTKISRFATRLHVYAPDLLATIEPYNDDYIVRIYVRSQRETSKAKAVVDKIMKDLKIVSEEAEEEEIAEEEEEEEEVEEEE